MAIQINDYSMSLAIGDRIAATAQRRHRLHSFGSSSRWIRSLPRRACQPCGPPEEPKRPVSGHEAIRINEDFMALAPCRRHADGQ
jgi:hypothetical protein